jgi:thiamine pyrophosphokinase
VVRVKDSALSKRSIENRSPRALLVVRPKAKSSGDLRGIKRGEAGYPLFVRMRPFDLIPVVSYPWGAMKVLLIADSPDFDTAFIVRFATEVDSIIVTDGALHKLPPSVIPHIVCGDFDSLVVPDVRAAYAQTEFVELFDQNRNDLEKALLLAISRGATDITIASAFGGQIDMSVANLSVMIRHHATCALSMVHGAMMTRVLSDRGRSADTITFDARPGAALSCISLDGDAVVTISNVQWPLDEAVLRAGSHGVGNHALGGPVKVKVHRGLVLVGYEIPQV